MSLLRSGRMFGKQRNIDDPAFSFVEKVRPSCARIENRYGRRARAIFIAAHRPEHLCNSETGNAQECHTRNNQKDTAEERFVHACIVGPLESERKGREGENTQ